MLNIVKSNIINPTTCNFSNKFIVSEIVIIVTANALLNTLTVAFLFFLLMYSVDSTPVWKPVTGSIVTILLLGGIAAGIFGLHKSGKNEHIFFYLKDLANIARWSSIIYSL